jgi:SAM-dependent methyltransferase
MAESLKTAQEYAELRDWPGYFRAVIGKPPRETLVKALDGFAREAETLGEELPFAIDLGCGEGRDTLELLRRGWRVLAIDESQDGLDLLTPRVLPGDRERLEVRRAAFHGLALPRCRLLNASFCLPFCPPADFPALWHEIVASIQPGGRFAGQFFGDRDDWASLPDRTHHTRAQVESHLREFDLEMFQEEDRRSPHSTGEMKQWHVFHVVGKRK